MLGPHLPPPYHSARGTVNCHRAISTPEAVQVTTLGGQGWFPCNSASSQQLLYPPHLQWAALTPAQKLGCSPPPFPFPPFPALCCQGCSSSEADSM